jgi:hypothetical protein
MKLVMTLLVRDEADIVDAQIAFHLHAGVDFVVATDNRSEDGTTEILERYARDGYLHLIREDGEDMRQHEWVTRMARLAATEFDADWVVNADADEFWWPRGGSLKDVLATVPERYGVVRACWRHFLPRPDDGRFFAERMTVRLGRPGFPGEKSTIFHSHQKVAHRADPNVTVATGNHDVTGSRAEPLRSWHPIEVLHFSFRSPVQLARKSVRDWSAWSRSPHGPTLHHVLAYEAHRDGRLPAYYESFAVDDEAVGRGLNEGTLAIDRRLRDALRRLRDDEGSGFRLPSSRRRLRFPRPAVAEDARYAGEAAALVEIDGIVRAEGRVEALERRLARLERRTLWRLPKQRKKPRSANGAGHRLARP